MPFAPSGFDLVPCARDVFSGSGGKGALVLVYQNREKMLSLETQNGLYDSFENSHCLTKSFRISG